MISSGFGQSGGEPLGVEDGFVLEHKVSGPGQFDGQDGIGLELVAVHFGLQLLGQGFEPVMIAFGDHGRFAKGPAQVRVAELGAAQTFDLAGAGDGAFDQAAVREEVFDGRKTADVTDLVENGQAEIFADAGDGLQQGVFATGDLFGLALEFLFELKDLAAANTSRTCTRSRRSSRACKTR
jgi:hypothetical protein